MFGASCKPQNVDRKVDKLRDVPDQLYSHDDEPSVMPLLLSDKIKSRIRRLYCLSSCGSNVVVLVGFDS